MEIFDGFYHDEEIEQLARKIVYQEIQSFIFHMNYNTRWGGQCPFSNITLSITVPEDMKDQLALIGGKPIKDYFDFMKYCVNQ